MAQIPGVILAGGQSRRMGGGDKPLIPLAGQPMLAHVLHRLAPQAGPLALNANGDPARFSAFSVQVIADSVAGYPGPLAGVLAGLEWAEREGAEAIVTVAADTPFFPCDLVAKLRAAAGATPSGLAVAATREAAGMARLHPTFGCWPVALRADLAAALENGVRKVSEWTDTHAAGLAVFSDADAFFNVNTPEDRAEAESRLAGLGDR